ncbi:MAG TPA: GxxExxY protein [Bacteroidales bacterium]|nr:GxxExxY protein [Bacteroidales bacterium]
MKISKTYLKDLVYKVNGAAIEVHKALGPGLLESVYHRCLEKELSLRNIPFQSELKVDIQYKGLELDTQLRCDFLIDNCLVVELKSVDYLLPVHEAQILTYINLLNVPEGLLINFNCINIYKEGQRTFVNEIYRHLAD